MSYFSFVFPTESSTFPRLLVPNRSRRQMAYPDLIGAGLDASHCFLPRLELNKSIPRTVRLRKEREGKRQKTDRKKERQKERQTERKEGFREPIVISQKVEGVNHGDTSRYLSLVSGNRVESAVDEQLRRGRRCPADHSGWASQNSTSGLHIHLQSTAIHSTGNHTQAHSRTYAATIAAGCQSSRAGTRPRQRPAARPSRASRRRGRAGRGSRRQTGCARGGWPARGV